MSTPVSQPKPPTPILTDTSQNPTIQAQVKSPANTTVNPEQQVSLDTIPPPNEPGVISFSVIESLVYESIEAARVDLYQYARKEIIYNERDFLKALAKKHQKNINTVAVQSIDQHATVKRQMNPPQGYDSLYTDTPLQLAESLFTLHPAQYKLLFPTEFEDLLNRLSERITAHVSEMTSSMLERVFALGMGQGNGGSKEARQAIKQEVMKEIGAEMQRFQRKYEESRELINSMRKNFLKELQHLKMKDTLNSNKDHSRQPAAAHALSSGGATKKLAKYGNVHSLAQFQNPQQQPPSFIEFSFFSPTEGMDEETCAIFNDHFSKMRAQFESKLATLNAINQELAWKVALIDEAKKVSDMTAEELIEMTFAKQKDRQLLWLQLKTKFTPDDLEKIAEEEFADLVAAITEREIVSQVERIQQESQFQIKDAREKMQKEINVLRMQLANRSEEIEKVKLSKIIEVDRAREEGYNRCEQRILGNMKMQETKFNLERESFQRQLQEAQREDQKQLNKLALTGAFTKWRLLHQISKMKLGHDKEVALEDILGAIQKGSANQYIQQVKDLSEELKSSQDLEKRLKSDLDQSKFAVQQKDDKIAFLTRELESNQEETSRVKAHLESQETAMRALEDELEQEQRAHRGMQELARQLQGEVEEAEGKVTGMRAQIQQLESQPRQQLSIPLREMSSIHGGESTLTDKTGKKKDANNGYASDASGKSAKQNISTSQRFNSKVYAQKQIGNMIGERQNTVGKVYVASVLNAAVDTSDLAPQRTVKTQWKGKHFDKDWDAKEKAKIKQYKDASVQINEAASTQAKRGKTSTDLYQDDTSQNFQDDQEIKNFDGNPSTGVAATGKGKWISNEDYVQLQGIRQYKTNVNMQIDEEKRQTAHYKELLADAERQIDELNKAKNQNRSLGTLKKSQSLLRKGANSTQARLEANKKRREEQENNIPEDDNSSNMLSGDELQARDPPDPEAIQKALDYMTQGKSKDAPAKVVLPEVYKRLWGGVAKKSKKVKELTQIIEGQRRLEWLKLLLSNNHLHLTDKKQMELLKQLSVYEEMLSSMQTTGKLGVRGLKKGRSSSTQLQGVQQQPMDMNKLLELFDDEQEAQFQRAMSKWQELERLKTINANEAQSAAPLSQDGGAGQDNTNNQTLENQSVLSPKNTHTNNDVAQNNADYVSMYITEQPISPPSFAVRAEEKGIQTDWYLLETLFPSFPMDQSATLPSTAYQMRLNQYMANKHSLMMSSTATGNASSLHQSGTQMFVGAQGIASQSTMMMKSSSTNVGHFNTQSRVILQSAVGQESTLAYADLAIGDPQKIANQQLFKNSRIRQASHHNQAAVMTSKNHRRSVLAQSHNMSPTRLQPGFVLDTAITKPPSLLASIKEPEVGRRTQAGLFGGKRGGPGAQMYQAIPTTNFLQPKGHGLYRDVNLRTPQILPNQGHHNTRIVNIGITNNNYSAHLPLSHTTHSHTHQQQAATSYKDSETEEMFGSSELNTMHPINIPQQTRGITQATFGYEPRVPTVTVAPHMEQQAERRRSQGLGHGSSMVEVDGGGEEELDQTV